MILGGLYSFDAEGPFDIVISANNSQAGFCSSSRLQYELKQWPGSSLPEVWDFQPHAT